MQDSIMKVRDLDRLKVAELRLLCKQVSIDIVGLIPARHEDTFQSRQSSARRYAL